VYTAFRFLANVVEDVTEFPLAMFPDPPPSEDARLAKPPATIKQQYINGVTDDGGSSLKWFTSDLPALQAEVEREQDYGTS
jgi:hypothetical protein